MSSKRMLRLSTLLIAVVGVVAAILALHGTWLVIALLGCLALATLPGLVAIAGGDEPLVPASPVPVRPERKTFVGDFTDSSVDGAYSEADTFFEGTSTRTKWSGIRHVGKKGDGS